MRRCTNFQLLFAVLLFAVCVLAFGRAGAQTYTVLQSFPSGTNGVNPQGLIVSGNTIYATASLGGSGGNGTVFKVNTDGTACTTLHNFVGGTNDGVLPTAGLILSGNILYGTTFYGGSSGAGVVFAISTDGTTYTNLHSFAGSDGANPQATLVLLSNRLYGTTMNGGVANRGTVFALNTDGTSFTNLHVFTSDMSTGTNSDGQLPRAGLAVSGNSLYGTTFQGGYAGFGTVFAINTDGTGFTNLHNFTGGTEGARPLGGVCLSSNILYGTTGGGGTSGNGTVFALSTDGTSFTTLHSFDHLVFLLVPPYTAANNDGASPTTVVKSGNSLYGTALGGGYWGIGTVFELNTDGTAFRVLHNFAFTFPISPVGPWTTNIDGGTPKGLILSRNTLYGTAEKYGVSSNGTVFSISLPLPQLAITPSGPNVLLSWPTDYAEFTLEETSNLGFSAVWTTNLSAPVIVNGQYTVTNPISGTQQLFRLVQ
jgi:uncharacterized repeat protein (TIGR03803 family)